MSELLIKPGIRLDELGDIGVETWVGHQPDRAAEADLVVASSAVPAHDPEVRAAREAGVGVWSRPDLLDALTARMPAIGFTGTHGKTTSTALAVTAMHALGFDPTFLVGGQMVDLNTGAHLGEPERARGAFRGTLATSDSINPGVAGTPPVWARCL